MDDAIGVGMEGKVRVPEIKLGPACVAKTAWTKSETDELHDLVLHCPASQHPSHGCCVERLGVELAENDLPQALANLRSADVLGTVSESAILRESGLQGCLESICIHD